MPSDNVAVPSTGWEAGPLCHRYQVVHLNSLNMQVGERGSIQTALWAFGSLGEDESEVLGTWLAPTSFQALSQEVLEDLKCRGVEKVRFFVLDDPEVGVEASIAYPGATVLPSVGHLLCRSLAEVAPRDRRALSGALGAVAAASSAQAARDALNGLATSPLGAACPAVVEQWEAAVSQLEPIYALSPRLRRLLLLGDGTVQQVQQSLNRAVARHGSFADREAAVSFLAEALRRAERRLDARGMDRAANVRTSVARSGSRVGTQALAL